MKRYRRKKNIILLVVFAMTMIFCISIFNGKIQTLNSNDDIEKKNSGYSEGSGTYDDPWILYEDATQYDRGIRAYIVGDTLKIGRAYIGGSDEIVMPDFPIWTGSDYKDKIKNVEINADEVTNISNHAFTYLSNLETVTFITEDGNISMLKTIEDYAFYGCSDLTYIIIPSTVTEIGEYAFNNCVALTNITIPDSVTTIGKYAFASCISLQNITMSNNVTKIEENTFYGCSALTNITIPSSVTEIGGGAFEQCTNLQTVTIPDSMTKIGDAAFRRCTNLQTITIPNSVIEIGYSAFAGCASNLTICCSINSYALTYALQNNLMYILIGDTVDNTAPTITTKYSTTEPTDGTVTVELAANEPIEEYEGWTLLDDKMTIRKEYSENVKEEKIYVADISGNQTEVTITINNIYYTITLDQQGGTGGIDNLYVFKNDGIYKDTSRNQKIEENSDGSDNIGILPTKEGYLFIGYKDSSSSNTIITKNGDFSDGLYDSLKAGNKEISDNTLYAQWLDITPPQVSVSYSTTEETYDSVTATITSDEALQPVEGWTLIGNCKSMEKKYIKNTEEEVTVSDEAGNTVKVNIKIENIKNKEYRIVLNKNGGTGGTDYLYVVCKDGIYKDSAHTQKVDTSNGKVIISELPTKEGLSFNGYGNEQNGGNIEIASNGEFTSGTYEYMIYTYNSLDDYNLYAQWIDNIAPQVTVSYSTTEQTYDSVTATITSNEALQSVEGWTLIGNCKSMEKKYTKNTEEEVTVSDEAGNTAKVNIKIENIVDEPYISGIKPGTTLDELKNNINIDTSNIKICDKDGNELKNTDKVYTGIRIFVNNEERHTVIVKGDVNGDGESDIKDILAINKHRLNKTKLKNEFLLAGNVNEDEEVDIKDILQINKFRLGKINSL